jgi:curved DNA-binding protein CbpA
MTTKISLYEILGVEPDATDEEIKAAYRKKAQETHPDMPEGSAEAFNEVNRAYRLLTNKLTRLKYDQTGEDSDTKVDNTRQEAIKELQRVMLQVLADSDDDIFFMDLPSHVLEIFNLNIQKSRNAIVDHKNSIRRLRRYKKRFHYKATDDNDFIAIGINAQIYSATTAVSAEAEKIRLFNLMLELLALYDYEPEIKPATFGLRTTP